MRLKVSVPNPRQIESVTIDEYRRGERAVKLAMKDAGRGLQLDLRRQVQAAGLGRRLANALRLDVYPETRNSMNAASLVYPQGGAGKSAARALEAADTGPLIKSRDGLFLAVPLPAAGTRGVGNKRITPLGFERRTGLRLRFVYRRGRPSLLVADGGRLNTRGRALKSRAKRRKDGSYRNAQTIPVFVLLPQVKLRKRIDVLRDARRWHSQLPRLIEKYWPENAADG